MWSQAASVALTETDVTLAITSEAVIIGFNVRADSGARVCQSRKALRCVITTSSMI